MARTLCLAAFCLLFSSSALSAPQPKAGTLVPKEQEAVDRITVAWRRGDAASALQLLSPLVAKLNAAKFAEVEQILADRGVPKIGSILAEARLALVQQGLDNELPKVSPREALLVLPVLSARIDEVFKLRDENTTMSQDPLVAPPTIVAFEQVLWDLHVLANRLENAGRLAEYTRRLAKATPRSSLKKLSEEEQQVLVADYQAPIVELNRSLVDLSEREMQLRIWRLQRAKELLAEKELTKEKFLAAYTAELDARLIKEYLQSHRDTRLAGEEVDASKLSKQVDADAAEASRLAGQLQLKAQMLFEGLHWWLRGRYGIGPEVFGLAKSRAAMKSLEAQFGLYMPAVFPQPTDPLTNPSAHEASPRYDRRHHYWWAWEDRQVIRSAVTYTESTRTVEAEGDFREEKLTTDQFF